MAACREQIGDTAAAATDYQAAIADLRVLPNLEALLAWCLAQLASQLVALGRLSESDSAFDEALIIQDRQLGTNRSDWLRTFATYTDQLWSAGRYEQAATVIADRHDQLHRPAVLAEPAGTGPDLATVLRVSARRLEAAGRAVAALPLAEAAVAVARRDAQPAITAADASHRLALSLKDLGQVLVGNDRLDEALDAWDDATGLLRALTVDGPATTARDLVEVLTLVAKQLFLAGRDTDAITSASEAIAIARPLGDDGLLASALHPKAFASSNLHHHQAASAVFAECIELRRASLDRASPADRRDLVRCMRGRAHDLAAIRRYDEALADLGNALALARQCRDEEPEAGADVLAGVLRLVARVSAETERLDDAVDFLRELGRLVHDQPSHERSRIEATAFAWALSRAPEGLPARWVATTGQSYPNLPTG